MLSQSTRDIAFQTHCCNASGPGLNFPPLMRAFLEYGSIKRLTESAPKRILHFLPGPILERSGPTDFPFPIYCHSSLFSPHHNEWTGQLLHWPTTPSTSIATEKDHTLCSCVTVRQLAWHKEIALGFLWSVYFFVL